MSIEKSGYILYDKTPGPDAPPKYVPQPLEIDPSTGKWDYPSTRGMGFEIVDYPLRGKTEPHEIQIGKVPHFVKDKLVQAHRQGHLREELSHHLKVLKENHLMDPGTLEVIRQHGANLTGHISRDEPVLDEISMVLNSCTPNLKGENR
jgi:hypothetical protein